jgi:thiamine biosynthesis lipoprotein
MRIVKKTFKALGTDILILVACKDSIEIEKARQSLKNILALYFKKENIFSRFNERSELNFFNKQLGKFQQASEDMRVIVKKSLEYYAESQGIFDPRIAEFLENIGYKKNFPENDFKKVALTDKKFLTLEKDLKIKKQAVRFNRRMDFSGIAKGYITDKAAEFLNSRGLKNFLVDSGGDIYASGLDEKKEKWKIGLEGFPEEQVMIEISNKAVATSGITRRKWESNGKKFHHLINPQNFKKFNFDLKSVTVIKDDAISADVWAKVLFLMGREKGIEFSNRKKIKSLFLDYKNNLYLSRAVKKYLTH